MTFPDYDLNGAALCLSGGGFRATLFHLGGLIRLNELGWLKRLACVSSVSGGSIVGAYLCINWCKLVWENDRAVNLDEVVIDPLREFCGRDVDTPVTVLNALVSLYGGTHSALSKIYDRMLFRGSKLGDLPESPRCLILGSDLITGSPVVFCKTGFSVNRTGSYGDDKIQLSTAVAVSTAYPPYLSPVALRLDPDLWQVDADADHELFERIKRKLVLTDGGMHDPLAVLPVWNEFTTVLVSDASQVRSAWRPGSMWLRQLSRTTLLQTFGNSGMTRLVLDKMFESHSDEMPAGVFWCADREIGGYDVQGRALSDSADTKSLCKLRTRLSKFTGAEQKSLINWGYAMCDAAMRTRFAIANEPRAICPVE